MATSQQQLVCDSSTLAHFKQWAQAISTFFATAGWTQSTDTGQVNWGTIASVPGSAAYVYEIWQPNDGLTNFYLKVEYGNLTGTNCPTVRLTMSTSTNGAGTPTGFVAGPMSANSSNLTAPSAITQYECNFSGAAGRMCVMMWRNAPPNQGQEFFAIERSLNSSGAYTGAYVTMYSGGGGQLGARAFAQQSLVFGVGPTANLFNIGNNEGGLFLRGMSTLGLTTSAFNGSIPVDFASPCVGYFDYAGTVVGAAQGIDMVEGVTFTATVAGSTHTYMPSKIGNFANCGPLNLPNFCLCMRYD